MSQSFETMETAVQHYKTMYPVLPDTIIQATIEYCLEHPEDMPDGWQSIDLTKPPKAKKEKIVTIDGAVEIYDDPNDPSLKVIKHREGAAILSAEDALELQRKVDEALKAQDEKL